ncbi:hypothetical protein CsatA_028150 [Cannabis sativa]
MSETVLGSLAHYESSFEAWRALAQRFSNQSKAQLLQIKSQLSTIQKGNLSISDYYDKVKLLADSLSTAGHPIDESDLIMHLLNGLGPEYDPVVVHVTSLVDNLSFESIQSLLLTHESRIESHNSVLDFSSKIIANLSINNLRNGPPAPNRYYGSQNRGSFHSRPPPRNPRSGPPSIPRLLCQVCHKPGHTAAICHYRFDKNFVTPRTGDSKVFLTEIEDQDNPQAYSSHTVPEFLDDYDWYANTGATNHVAQGIEPLDFESPYLGPDALTVGNGKQLPISHVGQGHRDCFAQGEG